MGIIGMKVYLRGLPGELSFYTSMRPYFDFALSHQVSTVVIGCDDLVQLEENAAFARSFSPLSKEEQERLITEVAPYARELMIYKR